MHDHAPVLRHPAPFDDAPERRADWLADDVVVEFPSIDRAIARMREAFDVDARRPRFSCAVRLTAAAACGAVRLSVDVPGGQACEACGGHGGGWKERCRPCEGRGRVVVPTAVEIVLPPEVRDGDEFRFAVRAGDTTGVLHLRVAVG